MIRIAGVNLNRWGDLKRLDHRVTDIFVRFRSFGLILPCEGKRVDETPMLILLSSRRYRPYPAFLSLALMIVSITVMAATGVGCRKDDVTATWQPSDRVGLVSSSQVNGGGQIQGASDAGDEGDLFRPPYPHRVDPFEFVKEPVVEKLLDTSGSKIRVIGFIDVDSKQVILSIDGQTRIVKEGETIGGVQVMAIESPNVRLRNLYQTWTVGLFDAAVPLGRDDRAE